MGGFPILSLMLLVPLVGAGICLLVEAKAARMVALIATLIDLALSIVMWANFDIGGAQWQFTERLPLFAGFQWAMGVDGIAMLLIVLTAFLMPICIVASHSITKRVPEYMAVFLFMELLMIGVFAAQDLFLFYIFFEGGLIPMYLIIGVWGGDNRVYAAYKFFLYTLLGSVLMLVAMLWMAHEAGTTDITVLLHTQFAPALQTWLFLAFLASFAVKVPMWPVHTWLPDAHVEAPTGGSVILAAITLKIGGYGFLRFNLPIAPGASHYLAGFMIALSLIAVVYIGLVALVQADMKKLIAYSSIAHMGFVTLGFFIFTADGMLGGIVQMVSHGFVSAALFLCVGVLYDRLHSRQIADYGGVANTMPVFAAFFVLFAMANSGLPGTSGFVGEFLVILGTMKVSFWFTFLAATTLITGAAYTLWMIKRVVYGAVGNPKVATMKDVGARELTFLVILAVAVLALGIYPKPLADVANPSIHKLLQHVEQSKLR
jgi:NADH-quinone oxidoreductase subunit M